MGVSENKRILVRFLECMNNGDYADGLALLASDLAWWAPGDRKGGMAISKLQMAGFVERFYAGFRMRPRFYVLDLTAEEDRVCARLSIEEGVTLGGIAYANDIHLLARFRGGEIVEVREAFNTLLAAPMLAELAAGASQT